MPVPSLVVHCKHSRYDIYIGRPSPWGNPFSHITRDTLARWVCASRAEAIVAFEEWARYDPDPAAVWVRAHVRELKGKVLGCWCAPVMACHGEVLVRMAEEGD